MGDHATGELWGIAVLPDDLGVGIGATLLRKVEQWLTTDVDTLLRAYAFYLRQGWRDDRVEDGLGYMQKDIHLLAGG